MVMLMAEIRQTRDETQKNHKMNSALKLEDFSFQRVRRRAVHFQILLMVFILYFA